MGKAIGIIAVGIRNQCRAKGGVSDFNGLSVDSGQRGPYSLYKPCNHCLYIGIIIFPNIDNPQSTGHNLR